MKRTAGKITEALVVVLILHSLISDTFFCVYPDPIYKTIISWRTS
jgi:hypothetical protein